MNDIDKLISIIKNSDNIVFFGGAGVSTESGLKDFRSKDGLYNEQYKFPPEVILSHSFFMEHPDEFFKFYYNKMNPTSFKPNIVHKVLTDLEKTGKLSLPEFKNKTLCLVTCKKHDKTKQLVFIATLIN